MKVKIDFTLLIVASIVMIALQLFGVISIEWWIVLLPLFIAAGLFIFGMLIAAITVAKNGGSK